MRYEIKGGSFPVVICNLNHGEQMITESGSMVWMSPNMQMETKGGGLGRMFSKAFSGESMFQNHYTAKGGPGMIAFASSFPGDHFLAVFQITDNHWKASALDFILHKTTSMHLCVCIFSF